MKRKILSLILVLMLLPFASIFSACGKDDGYNLTNLKDDFNNIFTSSKNYKIVEGDVLMDYSVHSKLEDAVTNIDQYKELVKYNMILNNSLMFSVNYIEVCSNSNIKVDASTKDNIQQDLNNLKNAMNDMNNCLDIFAEMVNIAYDVNPIDDVCLNGYENLLLAYNNVYEKAGKFSGTLSNLYFNKILNNGNPDVLSIGELNFDANTVVILLDARIKNHVSDLTNSYVETYLNDNNLAKLIAHNQAKMDLTKFGYSSKIEKFDIDIDEQIAAERANLNKAQFFKLAVQSQNVLSTLANNYSKFTFACGDINYCKVSKDENNATPHEQACMFIIKENRELLARYNTILIETLKIVIPE